MPVALGSDTGGSIRQPAAFCGVVGLKPTYGRVSRYGLVAFASSLDQIGPFARTVRGAAATLQVIAGHDPLDSTSLADPVPDYLTDLDEPLAGLRIGVVADHFDVGLDADVSAAVKEAIEVYRFLGADDGRHRTAAQQIQRRHLLPRRPVRGEQQPRPVRRRPLRPPGGERIPRWTNSTRRAAARGSGTR